MWVSYTLDFNILSTLHSVVSHSQPHVSQLLDFNMLSTLCPVVSSHMQVSYTLDFNMMSTLHSVVSQPHVSQLVSYTSDFNMMSTLYSVVSQPHVLQTGFQHPVNPVPCGVTATCDLVTNWILTCWQPCALWCHNHMCYKLDFDILSTPKAPLKMVKLCHKTYVNHYPDQTFKISLGHLDHCSIQEWNEMNEHVGSHKQKLPRRSYQ